MSKNLKFKSLAALGLTVGALAWNTALPKAYAQNRPSVVATSSVICGLTKQIAGSSIDLKCLIDAGADPHVYQPKPGDRRAIEQAKLILYSGYDFEPSLIRLIKATSNRAPKVAVAQEAVRAPLQFEEDGKTVPDPHVWHNAKNGIAMARVISRRLSQIIPSRASVYTANTRKLTAELTQIDTWIKSQIATIPVRQRQLVTTHDALGYYSKAYRIPVVGALGGISSEEAPAPGRVATLVRAIKAAGVPTIFAETTINPKLIAAVAREAKVKVSNRELYADGLGEPGTEGATYQGMLKANTRTIVEGLGGKYKPFRPR